MARPSLSILLTSAGRRVELLESFREAADALGWNAIIHACDQEPRLSAACIRADKAHVVPRATDPAYADAIREIATTNGIALVVPTIDPELQPLADARSRLAARGVHVAVGGSELVAIARDKQKTSDFLEANQIPAARSARLEDAFANPGQWTGPLFLKPCHGSSGRGARKIASLHDISDVQFEEPMLVQELLSGPEYTVNCYFSPSGRLRAWVPHERLRVRAGEVEKGITRRNSQLGQIAEQLAKTLPGPSGALCFQAMHGSDGSLRMFEINARFGGGYPLAHRAGAPFARWLIEDVLGLPSTAANKWVEGVTMIRHDSSQFLMP